MCGPSKVSISGRSWRFCPRAATTYTTELRKLGASVQTTKDSISITAGQQRGAEIETYDDHRIAMAFAVAGLRIPDVVIRNPDCVSKTWPEYFSVLEHLQE